MQLIIIVNHPLFSQSRSGSQQARQASTFLSSSQRFRNALLILFGTMSAQQATSLEILLSHRFLIYLSLQKSTLLRRSSFHSFLSPIPRFLRPRAPSSPGLDRLNWKNAAEQPDSLLSSSFRRLVRFPSLGSSLVSLLRVCSSLAQRTR